ncbi:unnamed protein product [Closterium sp. NIES-54]
MFMTLYFIVTRLLDSLRSVRDHFLSLDLTSLTVDLLEQHLLAAETSAVAVGATCGTPRPPLFEGCSPSPLAPSYASAAAADVSVAEDVEAASASAKRRSSKGKGGKGSGGGSGGGGGGSGSSGGGSSGGGGGSGTGGGSGGSGGGGGGSGGSGGNGSSGTGGSGTGARRVGSRGGQLRLQLRERFGQDLPVLRLYFDRRGEFSSNFLRDFYRGEGILQSFALPDSCQQNGIAERRIGLVIDIARTSMIHAAAPHFLWPFAVRYAAHQLNLWLRVSLPNTSPTLHWTGEVGDASMFQVWGSCAFVRDTSADKLSPRALPCVFLGFVPDAPRWQFYHPTSHRVFPSQDIMFDESVPFYRLFPYHSAPPLPPPLFLAPSPPPVAVGSGATRGAAFGCAAPGGAELGGAKSEGAETGGAELEGVETGVAGPGGVEPGAESGGAEPQGAALSGGYAGASPRLSPKQLREWFVRRACLWSGATAAGGARAAGAGGAGAAAGAGVTRDTAATGPGGACTRGIGAAGTGGVAGAGAGDPTESGATEAGGSGGSCAGAGGAGVGGTSARDAGVGGPGLGGAGAGGVGAVDPGGAVRPRPYSVPLLQQRRKPASRPVSPVRTACRVPRLRPHPVPGTHAMTLRPSSNPLRVPLPAPPKSSLPEVPDPESDRAPATSPTVSRLLATAVIDPSFESAAASALVAELLDFAAACRLDYATALVAESASASPPSIGGEHALGTDVLEDR